MCCQEGKSVLFFASRLHVPGRYCWGIRLLYPIAYYKWERRFLGESLGTETRGWTVRQFSLRGNRAGRGGRLALTFSEEAERAAGE